MWYLFYADSIYYGAFYANGNYFLIALFILLYACFAKLYGGFSITMSRISEIAYSQCIALAISGFFIYMVIWLLMRRLPPLLPFIAFLLISMLCTACWAWLATRLLRRDFPHFQTILIYGEKESPEDIELLTEKMRWRYYFIASHCITSGVDKIIASLQDKSPDAVMTSGVSAEERNAIIKYCIDKNIPVHIRPDINDLILSGSRTFHVSKMPILLCMRSVPPPLYAGLKRAMDITLSSIALIIASPFMLLTALAIKLYDGGPVLYKQVRLTQNGKPFEIYKFRSMHVNAEKDGIARLSSQGDDRITPIGKFIRMIRFDELPQLLNILGGSMSIVGPRPERPEIAKQYETEIPEFPLRLQVKAGLTGYAQVYGKYNTPPYEKLQLDLIYIANQGIFIDMKIILTTIKVLLLPESTEGIEEGNVTAQVTKASKRKRN